ncbi:hypothetical protein [Streptomyces sp. NPDC047928]|uniref:hypothetical protein n=1 Tax=unclassified Streptomyces TaxID=2593676 RepID=UPI0037157867
MARTTVASLLGLAGAAALVLSAFQPWYENRDPRSVPAQDLFTGLDDAAAAGAAGPLWTSMLLPLAAAAAIGVLALIARSKVLLALAGLVALATGVLWVVQQAVHVAPVSFGFTDLERGLWNAAGGVLLLLIATAVLPGRER